MYRESGDTTKAITHLRKTIELNPNDIEAYKNLAKILIENDMIQEAIDEISAGLNENPDLADLHYILAKIYEKDGQNEEAIYELKQALLDAENLKIPTEKIKQELNRITIQK